MADITSTFGSLSSTESSNAPAGGTAIGSGLDDNLRMQSAHIAAWRDQTGWAGLTLTSVAGTNTITATLATSGSVTFGPTALAANQRYILTPANTNTGATTLNITSPNGGSALSAKNIFKNGAALVGGELIANSPVELNYDGTQFNIIGSSRDGATLGTAWTSTSGTSNDWTGIPSGVKEIKVMFAGVSTNGTSNYLIQLGDSGGIETSGYTSEASLDSAGSRATSTAGFLVTAGIGAAADVHEGCYTLSLLSSSAFTWVGAGRVSSSAGMEGSGSKSLSAELTQIRLTTVNGTDTFDAGVVNISYRY